MSPGCSGCSPLVQPLKQLIQPGTCRVSALGSAWGCSERSGVPGHRPYVVLGADFAKLTFSSDASGCGRVNLEEQKGQIMHFTGGL